MCTWKAEPCRKIEWEKRFRSAQIPALTKAVGFTLATYANGDGCQARPGNDLLMADLGLSRRAVSAHLAGLRDNGWVLLVRSGTSLGRQAKASVYRLSYPARVTGCEPGTCAPGCTCS